MQVLTTCSQSAMVGVGEARRRGVDGVGREVEQLVDDRRQVQWCESVDLFGGPPEAGSPEQVGDVCGCGGQNILLGVIGLIRVSTNARTELESPARGSLRDQELTKNAPCMPESLWKRQ